MSTDEYSEDMPDEMYLHRTPSAASSSYPNIGSSSSCSLPMPSNMDMGSMQVPQAPMPSQLQPPQMRQKRKYTRRKHPEERKKRGPRTKDLNAPRMPLNGYVRFLNANRDRVKQENPDLTFAEVTKRLASEWSSMNSDQKKAYLDEAEKEKEKYLKELHEYQQTESYQEFMEMKQRAKIQQQGPSNQSLLSDQSMITHNSINSNQIYSENQAQYYGQGMCQSMQPDQYGSSVYQQQSYPTYNMNGSSKYGSYMAPTSNGGGPNDSTFSSYSNYNLNSHSTPAYGNSMPNSNYLQRPQMAYPNMIPTQPLNGLDTYNHLPPSNINSNSMDLNDNFTGQDGDDGGLTNSLSSILDKCDSVVDLPIFTEEFLEHNKAREQELRNMRTLTMEYEEANAISSKHIDDMRVAIDGLNGVQQKGKDLNKRLSCLLDKLKHTLVSHFHDFTLPHDLLKSFGGDSSCDPQLDFGPPTVETIDRFMNGLNKLHQNIEVSSCKEYDHLVQSIRNVVSSLDEVTI